MKKKIKKSKQRNKSSLFILLFLVIATFLAMVPALQYRFLSHGQGKYDGSNFVPENAKDNLQLYWFLFTSPTAIPSVTVTPIPKVTFMPPKFGFCSLDDDNGIAVPATCNCIDLAVICKDGVAYNEDGSVFSITDPKVDYSGPEADLKNLCKGSPIAPGDGRYCIAKPVVYLYPESPTLTNVRIESLGNVVVSDPLYPKDGWKNVLAYPNGDLSYQGKKYSELFFETEVNTFKKPEEGIILKKDTLAEQLGTIVDQLGLIEREKKEFLEFWIPRLQTLNSPYIFFSLLEKSEKEKLDKVIITPQPDTIIEFIAYFKPLTTLPHTQTLQLPDKPKREGFVSVEWGGILDK